MSTRLKGLLAANLTPATEIENGAFQLRDGLWLKNATGKLLDLLGRVYNETRQGRNDTDYRRVLQVKAASAVNGNPDEICTYLKTVYGYTAIEYINENVAPHYHAAFFIDGTASDPITIDQLAILAPAGVGAYPADHMALEDGTLECYEDGDLLITPRASSYFETLQDSVDGTSEIYQDTLSGVPSLIDTLEY
jgi:hypothetical protein